MKEKNDSIPKIVSRVTLESGVYYYCTDGNVYIADCKNKKLIKLDSDKKDIISMVKNRFIKSNNYIGDVIGEGTYDEMDR